MSDRPSTAPREWTLWRERYMGEHGPGIGWRLATKADPVPRDRPALEVEVAEAVERASLDRVVEERDELKKALDFYANEDNWLDGAAGEWVTEQGHPGSYDGFNHDEFEHDNGDKARAALQSGVGPGRAVKEGEG